MSLHVQFHLIFLSIYHTWDQTLNCERVAISLRKHCGIMSSSLIKLAGLAYLFTTAVALTSKCRCYPSESCWPSTAQWAALNSSVGGRLVATVPLGSPCHDPNYNMTVCKSLQENWLWPQEQSVPRIQKKEKKSPVRC